jgi:pimeloyl-ACP methyl ester carboxylesterase
MIDVTPQVLNVGNERIAFATTPGPSVAATGLFWLPGYKSDMASTKATALTDFARGRFATTRFDYSGHGRSSGAFEDGTIGAWLEQARMVFERVTTGPQVVIGSSMGGYIALLLLRELMRDFPEPASRIKALVLIAPAVDMTEDLMWAAFSPTQRAQLLADGHFLRPSDYGEPYRISRKLIEEGREHLIGTDPFDPGRPIYILQGLLDESVPASHTRRLLSLLIGKHVTLDEVPDGDHRLSRPSDIARLFAAVEKLAA